MIDKSGYRANVAIVLLNKQNRVFGAKEETGLHGNFLKGGVSSGETPLQAMYRELHEEVGLRPQDVEVIASTREWYKYDIPDSLLRGKEPICVGQKQKWFLLRLKSSENNIDLEANDSPEFDNWRWVSYWYPINHVVYFKQDVYRKALTYFKEFI